METSNESTGETLFDLTLFAGDTLASRSAQRGNATGQTIRDTCGLGFETALAHFDPDMRCWKMFGDISLWGEPRLLGNLPPSGMTRSGVLFLQPLWVPITDATGSSLWPTPTAHPDNSNANGKFPNDTLRDAVLRGTWPTPRSSSAMAEDIETLRERLDNGAPYKARLEEAVAKYPTPMATGGGGSGHWQMVETLYSEGKLNYEEKMAMQAGNGGKLSPTWVEWLMGFPTGWTDLEASETPSSPKSPKSSGA
jgi:hypothetical protein